MWIQLCFAFRNRCREKYSYELSDDKYSVQLNKFPDTSTELIYDTLKKYVNIELIKMKIAKITQAYFIPEYKKLWKKIVKKECQLRNIEGLRKNYKKKHPEATEATLGSIYPFWFSFYRCRPSNH